MHQLKSIFTNIFEKIDEEFRSCANCGFPVSVSNSMLCRHCFDVVMRTKSKKFHMIYHQTQTIKTYSLFQWNPNECNALSSLTLAMKGKTSANIWRYYAAHFLNYRMSIDDLPADLYFVPCPSSDHQKDHAWRFAEALSELTARPLLALFQRGDHQHFRKATRQDREAYLESRLLFSENITQDRIANRNIVFVDDIITTGTTAKAASGRLKLANSFEAWSLTFRTK